MAKSTNVKIEAPEDKLTKHRIIIAKKMAGYTFTGVDQNGYLLFSLNKQNNA